MAYPVQINGDSKTSIATKFYWKIWLNNNTGATQSDVSFRLYYTVAPGLSSSDYSATVTNINTGSAAAGSPVQVSGDLYYIEVSITDTITDGSQRRVWGVFDIANNTQTVSETQAQLWWATDLVNGSADIDRVSTDYIPVYLSGVLEDGLEPTPPSNNAPVVDAGADRVLDIGQADVVVTLDDASASDADSDPLTYAWTVVGATGGGTAGDVSFNDDTALNPTVTIIAAGTYTLRLTADDGTDTASDDVVITVAPAPSAALTVTDAGGNAVAGTTVFDLDADGSVTINLSAGASTPGGSGTASALPSSATNWVQASGSSGLNLGSVFKLADAQADSTLTTILANNATVTGVENRWKWRFILNNDSDPYDPDWTTATDAANFIKSNMPDVKVIRAHEMIRPIDDKTPTCVLNESWDATTLRAWLEWWTDEYVAWFLTTFPDPYHIEFDIINEAFSNTGAVRSHVLRDTFSDDLEFFRIVFNQAHATATALGERDRCTFFVTEYTMKSGFNSKTQGMYNALAQLLGEGIPIDAAGEQWHVKAEHGTSQAFNFLTEADRFHALGLEVAILEADVSMTYCTDTDGNTAGSYVGGSYAAAEAIQDAMTLAVMQGIATRPFIKTFQVWGFVDKYSWLESGNCGPNSNPSPFSDTYVAKSFYDNVRDWYTYAGAVARGGTGTAATITEYEFQVRINGGSWTTIGTPGAAASISYAAATGSDYEFRVTVTNSDGQTDTSDASFPVTVEALGGLTTVIYRSDDDGTGIDDNTFETTEAVITSGGTKRPMYRFADLPFAQGATVPPSTVRLFYKIGRPEEPIETWHADGNIWIVAQKIANAAPLSDANSYHVWKTTGATTAISSLVSFTPDEDTWADGVAVDIQVANVLQELVNQAGWVAGNDVLFAIETDSARGRFYVTEDVDSGDYGTASDYRAQLRLLSDNPSLVAEGGIAVGGEAALTVERDLAGEGGIAVGGEGELSTDVPIIAEGGIAVGGEAALTVERDLAGEGGIAVGGEGTIGITSSLPGDGGESGGDDTSHRLWLDVYDQNTLLRIGEGPVFTVKQASITRALDGAGSWRASVVATDPRALNLLEPGRVIRIWASDSAGVRLRGAGILSRWKMSETPGGVGLTIDGPDILEELKRKNTLFARIYNQQTVQDVCQDLISLAPGWGVLVEDSIQAEVIDARFDGVSLLKAFLTIAERYGFHIRASLTETRILEIGAFGEASGLRAHKVVQMGSEALANDDLLMVERLSQDKVQESSNYFTVIVPIGAGEGTAAQTLKEAYEAGSRTSPYPIQVATGPDGNLLYYLSTVTYPANGYDTFLDDPGAVVKVGQYKDLAPLSNSSSDKALCSNSVYDAAAADLARGSVIQESFRLGVKNNQRTIRPGDTVHLNYLAQVERDGETVTYFQKRGDFYVLNVQEQIADAGTSTSLEISNVDRREPDELELIFDNIESMELRNLKPMPTVGPPSTYVYSREFAPGYDAVIPMEITDAVLDVLRIRLRIKTSPFRSTSQGAAGGGGTAQLSLAPHRHRIFSVPSKQSGTIPGLNWYTAAMTIGETDSVVPVWFLVDSDANSFYDGLWTFDEGGGGTVPLPVHEHPPKFGIVDDEQTPAGVSVWFNNVNVTSVLFGAATLAQSGEELNVLADPGALADLIRNASGGIQQEHEIVVKCASGRGRLEATVERYEVAQGISL